MCWLPVSVSSFVYPVDPRGGFDRVLPVNAFENFPPLCKVESSILKLRLDILNKEIIIFSEYTVIFHAIN